jgi:hypothetical protein
LKKQQLTLVRILRVMREAAKIQKPEPQFLGSRGVVKVYIIRKVEANPPF